MQEKPMNDEKKWVAEAYEHGQRYHYYGATKEQALLRARAGTQGPNWDTIWVAKMPEEWPWEDSGVEE